jgi:hypothetical protein
MISDADLESLYEHYANFAGTTTNNNTKDNAGDASTAGRSGLLAWIISPERFEITVLEAASDLLSTLTYNRTIGSLVCTPDAIVPLYTNYPR